MATGVDFSLDDLFKKLWTKWLFSILGILMVISISVITNDMVYKLPYLFILSVLILELVKTKIVRELRFFFVAGFFLSYFTTSLLLGLITEYNHGSPIVFCALFSTWNLTYGISDKMGFNLRDVAGFSYLAFFLHYILTVDFSTKIVLKIFLLIIPLILIIMEKTKDGIFDIFQISIGAGAGIVFGSSLHFILFIDGNYGYNLGLAFVHQVILATGIGAVIFQEGGRGKASFIDERKILFFSLALIYFWNWKYFGDHGFSRKYHGEAAGLFSQFAANFLDYPLEGCVREGIEFRSEGSCWNWRTPGLKLEVLLLAILMRLGGESLFWWDFLGAWRPLLLFSLVFYVIPEGRRSLAIIGISMIPSSWLFLTQYDFWFFPTMFVVVFPTILEKLDTAVNEGAIGKYGKFGLVAIIIVACSDPFTHIILLSMPVFVLLEKNELRKRIWKFSLISAPVLSGVYFAWIIAAWHLEPAGGMDYLQNRTSEREWASLGNSRYILDSTATYIGAVSIGCVIASIISNYNSLESIDKKAIMFACGIAGYFLLFARLGGYLVAQPHVWYPFAVCIPLFCSMTLPRPTKSAIVIILIGGISISGIVLDDSTFGIMSDSEDLFRDIDSVMEEHPEEQWLFDSKIAEPFYNSLVLFQLRGQEMADLRLDTDEILSINDINPDILLLSPSGNEHYRDEIAEGEWCNIKEDTELDHPRSNNHVEYIIWRRC